MADSEGSEIDRTVGYRNNPDNYKEKLEKILRGEDTYITIKAEYEKNPENIGTIFKYIFKIQYMGKRAEVKELYNKIIENKEKAKITKITLPYGNYGKVNAYEYAKYSNAGGIYIGMNRRPIGLLEYIEEFPDGKFTERAYRSLANWFAYEGEEESDTFFKKALAKYPESLTIKRWFLENSFRSERNTDKAEKMIEDIISNYSQYYMNRIRLGYANYLKKKNDYVKLGEKYGKNYIDGQITNLARELISFSNFWISTDKNHELAEEMAIFAVSLGPDDPYYLQTAAKILIKNGKTDEALDMYGKDYLETSDNAIGSNLFNYANFWAEQDLNLESALTAAQKYLKDDPNNYRCKQIIAKIYIKNGNPDDALKDYGNEYIKDKQDNVYELNSYAWFWALEGKNLKSALAAANKAIELMPESNFIWDTLAMVHWKLKNYEEAVKAQEKAIELNPNDPEYKERLEKIKKDMATAKKNN